MENNDNLNIENQEIQTDIENPDILKNSSEEEQPKKKSPIPFIIFGALLIIAVVIVVFIFKGLNNSDIIDNQDIPSEPEEIQVGLTDYSASDAELSELKDLNKIVDKYVNDNYETLAFVSSYGFLYSLERQNNIYVKDLMSEGLVNPSSNIADYTDILYLKAADVGLEGNDFKPCTAFNTKDGYYLSAVDLEGKYYTEQEYHDLIFKYSFVHGDPKNPQKGCDNYKKITEAAAVDSGYDIKHIACDDKYAVVVANKLNNTSEFVEAVLVKDGEDWRVAIGNLAQAKNAKQTANKSYPDMELGLMPIYNIGDYDNILSDMTKITGQLVDLGAITQDEADTAYTCGAGSFGYVQTESGKRLIGFMSDNGKLDFNEVSSLEEAISVMVNLQDDPPVFIIKFN